MQCAVGRLSFACNLVVFLLLCSILQELYRTVVDLKQNIREEVAALSPNMLQRVMQNFQKCLKECFDNNGRHLTDTIFKK